jgi:hypothetical protein
MRLAGISARRLRQSQVSQANAVAGLLRSRTAGQLPRRAVVHDPQIRTGEGNRPRAAWEVNPFAYGQQRMSAPCLSLDLSEPGLRLNAVVSLCAALHDLEDLPYSAVD